MHSNQHPGVIETVKDDGIAVARGTGKVIAETLDAAGRVVTTAIKDVAGVGIGLEQAVIQVGSGAITGTEKLATGTEHAVGEIAGGAIQTVGDVGSTVAGAARHIVHGNPDSTRKATPVSA